MKSALSMNFGEAKMSMGESCGASATTRYGLQVLRRQTAKVITAVGDERWDVLFQAARSAANYAGGHVNLDEARDLLMEAAAEAGIKPKAAAKQIRRGFKVGLYRPKWPAPRTSTPDPKAQVEAWMQAVAAWEDPTIPAKTMASVKAILLALGRELLAHGRFETRLSYRQLAGLAGVTSSTVGAHRDRMSRWVVVTPGGHAPTATTTWRVLPAQAPEGAVVVVPDADEAVLAKDRFSGRKTSWLAFDTLDAHEPKTHAELARAAGVRQLRTVRKWVAEWVADGVAVVVAGGVIAVAGAALWGPAERAERRRARFAREREAYRKLVDGVADAIGGTLDQAVERLRAARVRLARLRRAGKLRRGTRGLRQRAGAFEARPTPVLRPPDADRYGPSVGLHDPSGRVA